MESGKSAHSLNCLIAASIIIGCGFTATAVGAPHATHVSRAAKIPKLSRSELCMVPATDPCAMAFNAVLKSAPTATPQQPTTPGLEVHRADRERILGDHRIALADPDMTGIRAQAAGPLPFQKRAPWVRRIETVGKEGIPFMKVPRGQQGEFAVGINRRGVLGFSLKTSSD